MCDLMTCFHCVTKFVWTQYYTTLFYTSLWFHSYPLFLLFASFPFFQTKEVENGWIRWKILFQVAFGCASIQKLIKIHSKHSEPQTLLRPSHNGFLIYFDVWKCLSVALAANISKIFFLCFSNPTCPCLSSSGFVPCAANLLSNFNLHKGH